MSVIYIYINIYIYILIEDIVSSHGDMRLKRAEHLLVMMLMVWVRIRMVEVMHVL